MATHIKSFWSVLRFDSLTIKHGSKADPGQLRVKWSQACLLCRLTRFIIHQTVTQKHQVGSYSRSFSLLPSLPAPHSLNESQSLATRHPFYILFKESPPPRSSGSVSSFVCISSQFSVLVYYYPLHSLSLMLSLTVLSLTFSPNILHVF